LHFFLQLQQLDEVAEVETALRHDPGHLALFEWLIGGSVTGAAARLAG